MTPLHAELTSREEQVLLMLGEGLGLREIGERLGISYWTARNDRDRARERMGCSTTTQAVAAIVRLHAAGATA